MDGLKPWRHLISLSQFGETFNYEDQVNSIPSSQMVKLRESISGDNRPKCYLCKPIMLPEDRIQEILVDPGQTSIRIDKFLVDKTERVSRSKIRKGIDEGRILVNGEPVKSNYMVRPHDRIVLSVPRNPEVPETMEPEDIPLDIVYEDDQVLVIEKQAGLVVHPGVGNWTGTLVNALLFYLQQQDLPIKEGNRQDRPGIVHRIDKDTSGLMVIAKTDHAMRVLADQFAAHTVQRSYKAIVWGAPDPPAGTIDRPIGRHPRHRLLMHAFAPDDELGKRAITHYETLEDLYYISLIRCRLETGRTHQIRVHMQSLGHPLFNDERYGGQAIRKGTVYTRYRQFVHNAFKVLPRQALHAASLGFVHPESGQEMYFESPLPADMDGLLDKWKHYLQYNSKS